MVVYMQEEERFRNSVMFDLLYVHASHPLAAPVTAYYRFFYQLAPHQRYPWPIDTNFRLVYYTCSFVRRVHGSHSMVSNLYVALIFCSGGMNGYLWLSVRNGYMNVVPSPVSGLQDVCYNQTL